MSSGLAGRGPCRGTIAAMCTLLTAAGCAGAAPLSYADNSRLNNSVVQMVYVVQGQAGCTTDLQVNPALRRAAQVHTIDLIQNRALGGDIGSDGSTPHDRAVAAGFAGNVAETVAINPAPAISSLELINSWYHNPAYLAIMRDCGYSEIGVWSENLIDRTVVVAVYGKSD